MFASYADRSTVQADGTRVYTVAAVLSTSEFWVYDFAPKWRAMLTRENLRCFHMTDFETRRVEPYKSWTNDKRVAILRELIDAMKSAYMIAGAVALDLRAYERLTQEQRARLGHPYRFCGALCLRLLSNRFQERNVADPVAYVFEAGDPGTGELKAAVDGLSSAERKMLHIQSLIYGNKDEYIQLQAADILAYEAGKAALRDIGAERKYSGQRKSLLAILNSAACVGYLFDEKTLLEWVEKRRDPFGYSE